MLIKTTFHLVILFALTILTGSRTAMADPTVGGCQMFPTDNVWNTPVDDLPVDAKSTTYINTIGPSNTFHADFGSGEWNGGPIGIPITYIQGTQPKVNITFDYADESDAGPYPIPADAQIEGGSSSTGDRHILLVDKDNCKLYEIYSAFPQSDGSWVAGSGAIFNLNSNVLRTAGWTSADAAGLPILPGLVRYEEALAGEIKHALRFTAPNTRKSYVWPGRHYASSLTDASYPPMGQRFRLKASYDISSYPRTVQVILTALKKYGMILADNGSAWYISGAPDSRWDDDELHSLANLKGSDFEAVDESSLMINSDSAQARQSGSPTTPSVTQTITSPSSTTITKGGALGPFYATLTNSGASSATVRVQAVFTKPDGTTWKGGFVPVTLAAGASDSKTVYIKAGSDVKTGAWTHTVNVYDTSGATLLDSDGFSFTVTEPSASSSGAGQYNSLKSAPKSRVEKTGEMERLILPGNTFFGLGFFSD